MQEKDINTTLTQYENLGRLSENPDVIDARLHAAVEVAVREVVVSQHVRRVRLCRALEGGREAQRLEPVRGAGGVHRGEQASLGTRATRPG